MVSASRRWRAGSGCRATFQAAMSCSKATVQSTLGFHGLAAVRAPGRGQCRGLGPSANSRLGQSSRFRSFSLGSTTDDAEPFCSIASASFNADIAAWALGLTAIAVIGYKAFPNKGISFDSASRTFHIPGSWVPLGVIMAIFFTKYAFAVMQGLGMAAARSPVTAVALSLIYGCLSGYFVARAASLVAAARKPRPGVEA